MLPPDDARRPVVAITRDEPADGPLSAALDAVGLAPRRLPTTCEAPLDDTRELDVALGRLHEFDWIVCASVRAVASLARGRESAPWPTGLRSAAVGKSTAAALERMGAVPPPVTAGEAGARALLDRLSAEIAPCTRVLALTVSGGRQELIEGLVSLGADVVALDAYRMVERSTSAVAEEWRHLVPAAVVVTSPSAGRVLTRSIGTDELSGVVVIAIGGTTAAELAACGLNAIVAPRPEFAHVATYTAAALRARTSNGPA